MWLHGGFACYFVNILHALWHMPVTLPLPLQLTLHLSHPLRGCTACLWRTTGARWLLLDRSFHNIFPIDFYSSVCHWRRRRDEGARRRKEGSSRQEERERERDTERPMDQYWMLISPLTDSHAASWCDLISDNGFKRIIIISVWMLVEKWHFESIYLYIQYYSIIYKEGGKHWRTLRCKCVRSWLQFIH